MKIRVLLSSITASILITSGCAFDQSLGPTELLFASSTKMAELSDDVWENIVKTRELSSNEAERERVQNVVERIVEPTDGPLNKWAVQIIKSDEISAFALPNRKLGVYAGLLDFVENDDQLAAVLTMLIVHVTYNHHGERFSQSVFAERPLTARQIVQAYKTAPKLVENVFGVTNLELRPADVHFLIPFSREQSLVADKISVRYLHRAGFDLDAALDF